MFKLAVDKNVNLLIEDLASYIDGKDLIDEFSLRRIKNDINQIKSRNKQLVLDGLFKTATKDYIDGFDCFETAIEEFGLDCVTVKNYDYCLSKSPYQLLRKNKLYYFAEMIKSPGLLTMAVHKAYELGDVVRTEELLKQILKIESGIDINNTDNLETIENIKKNYPAYKAMYDVIRVTCDEVNLIIDFVLSFLEKNKKDYFAIQFRNCDNDLLDINFIMSDCNQGNIIDLNSMLLNALIDTDELCALAWKITPRFSLVNVA